MFSSSYVENSRVFLLVKIFKALPQKESAVLDEANMERTGSSNTTCEARHVFPDFPVLIFSYRNSGDPYAMDSFHLRNTILSFQNVGDSYL